jgi:hypoxia up-regulated 1
MITKAKPLYIALLALLIEFTRQFGLGIDWGSEFHKSTMLLPKKGFQMVENSISKRKTPSIVSLCGEERFFESQAVIKFPRAACESFYMLNRFFEAENSSFAQEFSDVDKFFYENLKPVFEKHSVVFASESPVLKNFKREIALQVGDDFSGTLPENFFRLEEIFAMMLDLEKDNALKTSQVEFKEAMFTIWDNSLSIPARKRLLSSIHLAGLKPLGFVHENTAAAVYFSMDRKPENVDESEHMLFVNIGSLGTKLSLIKFHATNETLANNSTLIHPAVSTIKDLYSGKFSGHLLDVCLGEYALAKQIKDIKRTIKPDEVTLFKRRRLYNEIKRAKETITVNKEINFFVEDFFDDRHLNVKLSRPEFEETCKDYFDELKNLLTSFMKEAKEQNIDISKIEIIGGTVRVPRVQEIVKEATGIAPSTHINGDEGMAFGAAFIAANFSAGVRTKKIIMNDGPNYEINLEVKFPENSNQTNKDVVLFPFKSNYGSKKKMNIKKLQDDVTMILNEKSNNYSIQYHVTGIQKELEKFKEKNIPDWKVDFYFELDHTGIPKLANSELQLKENVTYTVNKTLPKTNATDNETAPEVVQEVKTKLVVHTLKLTIDLVKETYVSLRENKSAFEESRLLLKSIKSKELEKHKRSAIKNKLESFIYKLNNEAEDVNSMKFLSEDELSQFKAKAEEIDNFLFSNESETAELFKFENLIRDVEGLFNPLNMRKDEFKERDNSWNLWKEFHKNVTSSFEDLKNNKPWITAEQFNETFSKIETAQQQIEEFYKQQLEMPLTADPVFNRKMLGDKVRTITTAMERLTRIPKPKAEKPKENVDKMMEEILKNMKNNMTGTNFTKEQMDEMLKKMQDLKDGFEKVKKAGKAAGINEEDINGETTDTENLFDEDTDQSTDQQTEENTEQNSEKQEQATDGNEDILTPEETPKVEDEEIPVDL